MQSQNVREKQFYGLLIRGSSVRSRRGLLEMENTLHGCFLFKVPTRDSPDLGPSVSEVNQGVDADVANGTPKT